MFIIVFEYRAAPPLVMTALDEKAARAKVALHFSARTHNESCFRCTIYRHVPHVYSEGNVLEVESFDR